MDNYTKAMADAVPTQRVHIGDPKFHWKDLELRDRLASVAHHASQNGVKIAFRLERSQLDDLKRAVGMGNAADPPFIFGHPIEVTQ